MVKAEITVSSETVTAIQAHIDKLVRSQWQPIATAQRDGTAVLVWRPGADDPRVAWFGTDIEDGSTAWIIAAGAFGSVLFDAPTHWMALPEVPT